VNIALPAGVSVAVVLLFRLLGLYSPPPPGTWPPYFAYSVTYLAAMVGAEAGSVWALRRRAREWLLFSCVAGLFITVAYGYWYLTNTPPTPEERTRFVWGAYFTFVLSQFLFGFCTWKVVAFFRRQRA